MHVFVICMFVFFTFIKESQSENCIVFHQYRIASKTLRVGAFETWNALRASYAKK